MLTMTTMAVVLAVSAAGGGGGGALCQEGRHLVSGITVTGLEGAEAVCEIHGRELPCRQVQLEALRFFLAEF